MQKIIIVFCLAFMGLAAKSQQIVGKVKDQDGHPLQGASISIKGKAIAISNADGTFTLKCENAGFVSVSYVGYQSAQRKVSCNESVEFKLEPLDQSGDNVEIAAMALKNKSQLYQPVSVTKLTNQELKRGLGIFLDDAINGNVPGVSMQRRSVSGGQQFNIRGYGNGSGGTSRINSNFDGQGYKVYLNGIPVTDAEGITVMDDIDFNSIGNVEIIKGPSGTLYGLATAGVVNLQTVKPIAGTTEVGQDVLFGSNGLVRYTTHFARATDHSSLLVNYGHQQTDGYTIHNASKKDFVNISGESKPTARQTIGYYFGYSNSYDERSGELTLAQYKTKDYSGNIEYIKRNGHSALNGFRAGIRHSYQFSKTLDNTTIVFGTGLTNNASSAGGWTDKSPFNVGFRSVFNVNKTYNNGLSISGISGVEWQRQVAQTVGYGMIDPQGSSHIWKLGDPYFIIGSTATGSNGITSNKYTLSSQLSFFTDYTLTLPKELSISAGVGIGRMKIDLQDRYYVPTNTKPTAFDTSYRNMVSPHFAVNKVFNKNVSAYFSYSTGYKAPVSSYFYIPFVAAAAGSTGLINQGLKPEKGNQIEIGTKGSLLDKRLVYQLSLYDAVFANKMAAVNVLNSAGTSTLYTYIANSGKQDDKGIEGVLKYTVYRSNKGLISSVTPFVNFAYTNYTYVDYKFHYKGVVLKDSVVNFDGKAVAGVPKKTINIGVDCKSNNGFNLGLIYMYKGAFPITSDGNNQTVSYGLLNAKIGYEGKLISRLSISASVGINNITGVQYPIMVFVNQLPDAYIAAPLKAQAFATVGAKWLL